MRHGIGSCEDATRPVPTFSVEDVLRSAASDEDRAASIHRALAGIIRDHSDQFTYMAVQEQNHRLIVERLAGTMVGNPCPSPLPTPLATYLSALLSTRVCGDQDAASKLAVASLDPGHALRLAIQVEKDALLLYLELRGLLGEAAAGGLDTIVREEHVHISDLAALLRASNAGGSE